MKVSFIKKVIFNVSPEVVYHAWLTSDFHTNMTGGEAICSDQVGASFSAWDGYIFGKNVSLIENEEIIQLWRTTEFDDDDEDSNLKINLKVVSEGTELTLTHSNIPDDQSDYEQGWVDHYFIPMKAYFELIK